MAVAMLLALSRFSAVAVGAESVWSASEEPNPISGGLLGVARMEVDELRIMVRCESATRWVEVRLFPGWNLDGHAQPLTWQFDRMAEVSAPWLRSPNGRSLIAPMSQQGAFIRGLRAHRNIRISFRSDADDVKQVTVPLSGSAAAISQAVRGCE